MRILLVLALVVFGVKTLTGQINPMDKLFKDKPRDLTLYLNPTFEYSQIALQRTMIGGLGAGVIINKKISLGGVYKTTVTNINLPASIGTGKLKMAVLGIL